MTPNDPAAQAAAPPVSSQVPAPAPTFIDEPPLRAASPFSLELLRVIPPEKQEKMLAALIDVETERQTFEMDQRNARSYAQSGLFSDIKGSTLTQAIAQAMTKIQMGREWGMNRADAMKNIYFIKGKPAIENAIVARKLQEAGYSWLPEWTHDPPAKDKDGKMFQKCTGCTIWISKNGKPMLNRDGSQVSVSFTAMQADHAEIYEDGKTKKLSDKFNYQSFGDDMYYWRCISRLHKYYAPAILSGARIKELEELTEELDPDDSALTVIEEPAASPNRLREIVLGDEDGGKQ